MATFACTFIFNWARQGWSETFYHTDSDIDTAMNAAILLSGSRYPLLGKPAYLEAIRVSDVAVLRDSKVHFPSVNQSTSSLTADTVSNAWLVRIESGALYRRSFFLRGVPDSWIQYTPEAALPIIAGAFASAFTTFREQLINGNWQLKVFDKVAGAAQAVDVLALEQSLLGWVTVSLAVPAGVVPGQTVRLAGFDHVNTATKKLLNGTHKVVSIEASDITINLKWADLVSPSDFIMGKLYRHITTYVAITKANLVYPRARQTGRAFFVPAGRRSK